ncbi:MAG: cell envelope integrity protein CreD [Bacteroidota bacterium]
MKQTTNLTVTFRLWLHTYLALNLGLAIYFLVTELNVPAIMISLFVTFLVGIPGLFVYYFGIIIIDRFFSGRDAQFSMVIFLNCGIALLYSILPALLLGFGNFYSADFWEILVLCTGILSICGVASLFYNRKYLQEHFCPEENNITCIDHTNSKNKNYITMEHYEQPQNIHSGNNNGNGNKALIKGLITGGLILLMLIPTIFISNMITERQQRQQQVVNEVSSRWASAQTITGPYIYIPYTHTEKDNAGKEITNTQTLILLPDNLDVSGTITPEQRLRSIYKVLLYKSQLNSKGNFMLQLPKDIDPSSLLLSEAKVCVGISDFKGIEQKIDIQINGVSYTLSPGLPTGDIDSIGLSASISLTKEELSKPVVFDMLLKLKGSEQLHFVPLSGNSQFAIQSTWPSPSFDGNTIPSDREVSEKGFSAKWVFNKANLPFGTLIREGKINKAGHDFGISMVQPADQYAKTTRSVKYAILIIGLTFSLFFIIELLQKKPVHPVQYVLIGISLVIFYTLLLSISEFVLFDRAYLIAALATISLITLYAKSHFKSWKTAGIFASLLSSLYAFIFILIRLEDTALLVGSIGLFIVLSLVMYASRKINWYHASVTQSLITE